VAETALLDALRRRNLSLEVTIAAHGEAGDEVARGTGETYEAAVQSLMEAIEGTAPTNNADIGT